jgi:CRP-like cAMP-binding protein
MRTPELAARHRASSVVSRMLLICCRSAHKGYNRNKNLAVVFPEMLVIMAIRSNDQRERMPLSANAIAKATGLPRANVQRWLPEMVAAGVIERRGRGYIGCDDYMQARLHAQYFRRIVRAIRAAARALEEFQ